MTTYQPGDRFTDPDGRTFRLMQRVDPRGPTPAYWRAQTVTLVTGVDASTGLPTSEERPTGHESTIREDLLASGYRRSDG